MSRHESMTEDLLILIKVYAELLYRNTTPWEGVLMPAGIAQYVNEVDIVRPTNINKDVFKELAKANIVLLTEEEIFECYYHGMAVLTALLVERGFDDTLQFEEYFHCLLWIAAGGPDLNIKDPSKQKLFSFIAPAL